jgi:hypothetical protein
MIDRAAASAGLGLKAHPHMLRHACGYALANVVSHEPEPSAEHPVKGRSPGADLITAIASWIFH